jgi:hypothetical protein
MYQTKINHDAELKLDENSPTLLTTLTLYPESNKNHNDPANPNLR